MSEEELNLMRAGIMGCVRDLQAMHQRELKPYIDQLMRIDSLRMPVLRIEVDGNGDPHFEVVVTAR